MPYTAHPLTETRDTDILLANDPVHMGKFVGIQFWYDLPLVIRYVLKKKYCDVPGSDVYRSDDNALLTAAIEKHNAEKRTVSVQYALSCMRLFCPDLEKGWRYWQGHIRKVLRTYPFWIYVPLP